ncbi:zinc finger CCCH domain-containing protein 3-like [Bidens hawaiensis]|uniref:zinc finger CCCH domain-containing protein 3-like n=1 Tax=Bidens hawaiensis TaxID=980011 RepID=UPI0040497345
MSDDLHVQNNSDVTNASLNPLGGKTEVKEDKTGSMAYPDHPEEQDCAYYLKTGICGYGDKCKFNHPTINVQDNNKHGVNLPEREGEPDCAYFLKMGTCVFGSTCKYNHPRDRHGAIPVLLSAVGLPMRQGQESCSHYLRTGSCKFGVGCKFHHPHPIVYGPNPTYAPACISAHAWPYLSQQTFVPVIISSSGPTQSWGPHMGNMSPILSTNGLTFVDHVNPSTKSSKLPERPGEPECRYFMYTRTCKYMSRCKYHHPKEHVVKYGASPLGPFGLPSRPGQPICWYYSLYGACNYGADCKFDHPLMAYSYNHFNGLTTLQMVDSSSLKSFKNPSSKSEQTSLKNPSSKSEEIGNVMLGTDDSCGDRVGSSHS